MLIDTRAVWISLVPLAFVPLAAPPGSIFEIRVAGVPGVTLPRQVKIIASRMAGDTPVITQYHAGRSHITNEMPVPLGVWRTRVEWDGLWAADQIVRASAPQQRIPLRFVFWPASRIRGQFGPSYQDRLPEKLQAIFALPQEERSANVICTIVQRAWTCAVPATALEIEFRLDGFASVHRKGVRPPEGGEIDLGTLPLQPVVETSGAAR